MWLDDLFVLLLVVLVSGAFLIYQLFVKNESTFQFWEKLEIQKQLNHGGEQSIQHLDQNQLMQQVEQRHEEMQRLHPTKVMPSTDQTTFVLSEYSLPVCRSLWRIVEYVLSDFIDFWWIKISDTSEFNNDLRDVFDHAFNVLGERCIKVDWSPFIVKNVISNLNYLMRIYRLTEQEVRSHNPFFENTPEATRHRLLKAELMRTYKLHAAVSNPQAYLRKLSTAVLSQLLRSTDFRSETVRTLARELMTTFVFIPCMNFVEPYWLNVGLVNFLKQQQQQAEKDKESNGDKDKDKDVDILPIGSRTQKNPKGPKSFDQVGYSPLHSPQSSRPGSPTQGLFSAPVVNTSVLSDHDENIFDTTPSSTGSVGSANNGMHSNSESMDSFLPNGYTPQRKDSILTQKMKDWEGEKAKRNEKKNSRKAASAKPAMTRHMTLPTSSSDLNRDTTFRPHDEDVPTGLISPQGAFSHSPNHATSPLPLNESTGFTIPDKSQLTPNWEVRIVGAGIRFDPKPFVMYTLLVKNGDSLKWSVVKRYNKFEELHNKLKKAIPSFDAQLPKKHFFNNLEQQFILNRKVELQTYLGQLLWNKNVQMNADLQDFLLPSAEDAKWAQQPGTNIIGPNNPSGLPSSKSFSFFGAKGKVTADDSRIQPLLNSSPQANQDQSAPILMTTSFIPQHHSLTLQPSPSILQQANMQSSLLYSSTPEEDSVFTPSLTDSPHRSTRSGEPTSANTTNPPFNSPPTSPKPSSSTSQPPLTRTYSADDLPTKAHSKHRSHLSSTTNSNTSSSEKANSIFSTWEDKQLTEPLLAIFEEVFNLNGRGWMGRQVAWVGKQLVKVNRQHKRKSCVRSTDEQTIHEY